jgi:hypothetical protein
MPKALDPNESYTFSKYFDLPYSPEDILADLGCTFERTDREDLPYTQCELDWLALQIVLEKVIVCQK